MPRGRGNAISGPASWHTRGAVRMLGAGGRPRRHGKATVSRVLHGSGGSAVAWLAGGASADQLQRPFPEPRSWRQYGHHHSHTGTVTEFGFLFSLQEQKFL